jgi:cell wall-associated NlpC family hydrolase
VEPAGNDAARVRRLLRAAGRGTLGERIDRLSARLLGRPYRIKPLGGGPGVPEVLRASLAGFDCVTFVETVLALAQARDAADFTRVLRRLRYKGGRPAWSARNHYMTGWAKENAARGLVRDLTRGPGTVRKERVLSVVPGLPPERVRFRCFPKKRLLRLTGRMATGDIVLFASTRRDLDVFHAGLLVKRDGEVRLRHATRSQGRVVEQPLREFLARNRMSGLLLLRPGLPSRPRATA